MQYVQYWKLDLEKSFSPFIVFENEVFSAVRVQKYIKAEPYRSLDEHGIDFSVIENLHYTIKTSEYSVINLPDCLKVLDIWSMIDSKYLDQSHIIHALFNNEVQGSLAKKLVHDLFIEFFKDKREELRKYFPKYVEMIEKN